MREINQNVCPKVPGIPAVVIPDAEGGGKYNISGIPGNRGTIYIYCPIWRETWNFFPPRKFMSPEGENPDGDMNFLSGKNLRVSRLTGQSIVYYTESISTTLYSAERCAVRHDRETRRLEGNATICSPSTWLL